MTFRLPEKSTPPYMLWKVPRIVRSWLKCTSPTPDKREWSATGLMAEQRSGLRSQNVFDELDIGSRHDADRYAFWVEDESLFSKFTGFTSHRQLIPFCMVSLLRSFSKLQFMWLRVMQFKGRMLASLINHWLVVGLS